MSYYVKKDQLRQNFTDTGGALMDERLAAGFLGCSITWLRRRRGACGVPGGPPFVRVGNAVKYARADLAGFIKKNTHNSEGVKK